jgi:hypothetical protein
VAGFRDDVEVEEDTFSEFAGAGRGDDAGGRRIVGTVISEIPKLAPTKIADDVIPSTPPRTTLFDLEAMLVEALNKLRLWQ